MSSKIKALILRFFGTKKQNENEFELPKIKSALFFRYDRIGDMIITTPVFRELKLNFPKIKITVLASKINHEVLANNPFIDEIVLNDKHNFFSDLLKLLKLRKKNFDLCFELDHSVIPHAILRLKIINPKKIISVKKNGRYGIKGSDLTLYDIYTDKPNNEHLRNILLLTLSPLNINPISNNYDLFLSNNQIEYAKKFRAKFSQKFLIGINLSGAVKGKKIKFSLLNQLCTSLFSYDNNIQILILTTPTEHQYVNQKLKKMRLDFVSIAYKTETILDVSALISELDLVITPDTSIVHIASAFDIAVVSIHERNYDSYNLFAPTSTFNRTVFSESKDSLKGFSLDLLLEYSFELIDLIKNEKTETI